MKTQISKVLVAVMLLQSFHPALAALTSISSLPLEMSNAVKPNMVLAIDDSGSMDFEVMLSSNDGALWWDANTKSFTDSTGKPWFNATGTASGNWYKYAYLFPNGTAADARNLTDSTNDHFAIPPTDAYAFVRSADYNPLYYNPLQTYVPWSPSWSGTANETFPAGSASAARSHPIEGGTTPTTISLSTLLGSTSANWTFRMQPGMVIPGASMTGITARKKGATSYSTISANYTITTTDGYWDVNIPYIPATYYKVDSTCTSAPPACVAAPDGRKLRKVVIAAGSAEMQNFANWFTYYRKRRLMLGSSMSAVLPRVTNIRMGMVLLNANSAPTMVDFASTTPATNYQYLLGKIYRNNGSGGTPTRETLKYVGEQYRNNTGLIQYACQRNAAMVVTDGFANSSAVTVGSYDRNWVNSAPYTPIASPSLAEIASFYYGTNLRTDLSAGLVPFDPANARPDADKNSNLHMNTYGLTLGAKGTIFGTGSNQDINPYGYPPAWPVPNTDRSPTAVDDLWHATLNGRGKMMTATDTATVTSSLKSIIADLLNRAGAGSAVTVSNVNIQNGDNTAYVASYNAANWFGDLIAAPINISTGSISTASPLWSLKETLTAQNWTTRNIGTYDGANGIAFAGSSLTSVQQTALNTPGYTDYLTVINWLRGDRSNEGTVYRSRTYVLGDIVNAEPVLVKGAIGEYADAGYLDFRNTIAGRQQVVYQAANDGMLHAVDAASGQELWAYIPSFVIPRLNQLTNPTYSHQFYVDGTPAVGDAYVNGSWKTLLVGGLRAGGQGFYALNITNPGAGNVASRVMWEFPNNATATSVRNNVGYSFAKPVITKTRYGWVVLVTSGYNNTAGDGKGHLFVLDPASGAVIRDLGTGFGSAATPSGLGPVAAFNTGDNYSIVTDAAYGGDLQGNLWKFDLSSASPGDWSVTKLATLTDGTTPQPITATPELGMVKDTRVIYVGTGRLIGSPDMTDLQVQSVYAISDPMTASAPIPGNPRSVLQVQTVSIAAGDVRHVSSTPVDFSAKRGWYFDLPAGEKMNVDPQLAFGTLVFNTNMPSSSACGSNSYTYVVDQQTGGELPSSFFPTGTTAWGGKMVGHTLVSRPVVAVLPNGNVVSIEHRSDDSVVTTPLLGKANKSIRKVAWKEVKK